MGGLVGGWMGGWMMKKWFECIDEWIGLEVDERIGWVNGLMR